ncbi:MAG: DUF309 domain-containing protein [Bdellovibrionota bacterium]
MKTSQTSAFYVCFKTQVPSIGQPVVFNGALVVPLELSLELNTQERKEYLRAIELFNSKYFWECHEVLEDIWMIKQPPLKTFLQGVIQAAAAFYHVLGENPKGAIKLAQDSLNKFEKMGESHLGLDLNSLRKSLLTFKNEAQEIIDQKRSFFTLKDIPVLKLPELEQ